MNGKYDQFFWKEIVVDPDSLDRLLNYNPLEEQEHSLVKEAKIVAKELIFERLKEIADRNLTPKQKQVLDLLLSGKYTYNEMAYKLGGNYTTIPHAIHGIKSKKHGKFHGGLKNKLKKKCRRDKLCMELLDHYVKIKEGSSEYALDFLKKYDDENLDFWENYDLKKDEDKLF